MGEGNANLVITNKEKDLIIRLPKSGTEDDLSTVEYKLRSTSVYMNKLVRPVLGDRFIVPNTILTISSAQLQQLRETVGPLRPAKRKHRDVNFPMGLVMPNLTSSVAHFSNIDNTGACVSVELKPKSGYIIPENTPHPILCNFCLKQHFKHSCEKVRSDYCPLGLFYGNQEMIKHALFSLLQSPQNNIRIFGDGTLLHDETSTNSSECLEYLTTHVGGQTGLVDLLATALVSPYSHSTRHKVESNSRGNLTIERNVERKILKCKRKLYKKIHSGDSKQVTELVLEKDNTKEVVESALHEDSVLKAILNMQTMNKLSDYEIKGIYEDLLRDGLSDEEIHNLIVHQCYQGNKHNVSYILLLLN